MIEKLTQPGHQRDLGGCPFVIKAVGGEQSGMNDCIGNFAQVVASRVRTYEAVESEGNVDPSPLLSARRD
jgi:hypothetical protein